MATPLTAKALDLFAPIAGGYERWASVLSLGQDPRWRDEMVAGLNCSPGAAVLDVAAGTGSITRELEARGARVIALDQSFEMLRLARTRGARTVLATAQRLPFADATFDAVTFSYLLRYVDDPASCMRELARVLRPGGSIGMVEFGRPGGCWGPWWTLFTRVGLPVAGALVGSGWREVGSFLGPSIDAFHRRFAGDRLPALWHAAGLTDVRVRHMSLGGGLIVWARKP